jgi:hypothetical protein
VITIGTPFRGSEFANSTTRWLGSKLISLPQMFTKGRQHLYTDNPDVFKQPNVIDVATSIDSLAPDSPFLPAMLTARHAAWVRHHAIVGRIPDKGLLGKVVGDGDGVVSYASAHLDNVDSEIVVNADHTTIHSHPLSVLEVHRILLAHLAEVDRPPGPWPRAPMTASAASHRWAPNRPAPPDAPMRSPIEGSSSPPFSAPIHNVPQAPAQSAQIPPVNSVFPWRQTPPAAPRP